MPCNTKVTVTVVVVVVVVIVVVVVAAAAAAAEILVVVVVTENRKKQVRNVLWTQKGVCTTVVIAGLCTHAELTSGHCIG